MRNIKKIIVPENNAWKKIIARVPGECVICHEEIIAGEDIQNNSDQRINRHQKCVNALHEVDILKEKIIKLFILGDNKKATELYGEMAEIEANKIIKNCELEDKDIIVEKNNDKNKEFGDKLKNDKELKNAANNLTYPEFVKLFKKKYVNYAKVILGDNVHARIILRNKEIKLRKEFDDEITHKYYSDWTEEKLQQKPISKNTLALNMRYHKDTIYECTNYIYWIDRYHDKKSMEMLFSSFNPSKVKDIRIIASGFAGGTIDFKLHDYVASIASELSKKNISLSFKIITDFNMHKDTHNRYILSSNVGYDVPSYDAIREGQDSTISALQSNVLENKTKIFLENWEKEQVIDLVKDWGKISEFLEKRGNAKSYRRECQICKSVFDSKPQFRDNPTCPDCFRKNKR